MKGNHNDKNDWYRPKNYVHIGLKLDFKDKRKVVRKIKNKNFIAHYAFLPLIHRRHISYKRSYVGNGKRKKKSKVRHICFASHFDSQIYSYYAYLLGLKYEQWLIDSGLSHNVVAYRSIPTDDGKSHKGHVHFAKEVIDEIKGKVETGDVGVIVADITGFFDNLDHEILRSTWQRILGCKSLPPDHLNVFRNTTHFSYIDENRLFKDVLNKEVLCKTKSGNLVTRKVCKLKYFRRNNVVAFCKRDKMSEIRESGFIETGNFNFRGKSIRRENGKKIRRGIPQGLPISAVLANIYMMDFDRILTKWSQENNALYRRYSDDIAMVLPFGKVEDAKKLLFNEISNVRLEIQEAKTQVFRFCKNDDNVSCLRITNATEPKESRLNYLGLCFDGRRILLKDKSVSKYYSKLNKAIRTALRYAISIDNSSNGRLFIDRVLRRFTLAGSYPHSPKVKSDKFSPKRKFGNYLSYARRASKICVSEAIPHQLSKNLNTVNKQLENAEGIIKKYLGKED